MVGLQKSSYMVQNELKACQLTMTESPKNNNNDNYNNNRQIITSFKEAVLKPICKSVERSFKIFGKLIILT